MRRHTTTAAALAAILLLQPVNAQAPLRVEPDPANPIAQALAGDWRADAELGKRLGPAKAPKLVTFHDDAAVLATLPATATEAFAGKRIHAAGRLRLNGREDVYVLTEGAGAMVLRTFREGSSEARSSEALTLVLVRGATPAQDLLFLNGDVGKQAFAAFARALPAAPKLDPAAALTEMARLLETKQYEDFLRTWCLPDDVAKLQQGGRTLAEAAARFGEKKAQEALESLLAAAKLTPLPNAAGDEMVYEGEGLRRRLRLQLVDERWYLCNR